MEVKNRKYNAPNGKNWSVVKDEPNVVDLNAPRLLVISSGNKNSHLLASITRQNVKTAVYQYENSTLDDILAIIIAKLGGIKVESIAFIVHSSKREMYLAGVGNVALSVQTVLEEKNMREFFLCLTTTFMNISYPGARIDFLDCPNMEETDGLKIIEEMKKLINCPFGICSDLSGSDEKVILKLASELKYMPVGEFYFFPEKLTEFLNSSLRSQIQNLSGYEKVRTVGKGAFGTAILYRKKDDDSLIIVKEINMHDLTASERHLAINEVSVLSLLNHENIVSYYDSFEEDGVLMIEMEYADGGTLAQYLAQMKSPIEEREVLLLFKQIVSAIKHMHEHNILHRDLKTANIFLTKEGIVKVGDFGISKMLTTRQGGAITVVGTPYYISPEMCEGKYYNQKSDIWALGCILYEMACQQKTFEGSNLPALVNKIVKGQFAPVRGNYSPGFKQLIRDLLQKDPDFRPTATEILDVRLQELMKTFEDSPNKVDDDAEISMDFSFQGHPQTAKNSLKQPRSVLYDVKMHLADISLTPVPLPPRNKIKEVALSSTHMIVLTSELLSYTWGDGRKGQLGHGKLETWREKPECVETLKGKNITRICAGEGFSIFSSDNGIVMTCGNGSQGCLGHGDWNMCVKPKLIEKLLSVDVSAISCGPHHVVVVGGDGEAYAWGCGSKGRLGTGKEDDCCVPTEVQFPNEVEARRAYCGYDGTMFVTENGSLLACGLNEFNKLGLNEQRGFLAHMKQFIAKTEVEKQLSPVKLGWLHQRVVSVSMGMSHTAVLVEPGKIITFGYNKSGQLGRGNLRTHSTPSVVKSMGDRTVTMVQCGDTFTIAGTAENAVYFWGSRQVLTPSPFKGKYYSSQSSNNIEVEHSVKKKGKTGRHFEADYVSEISEASISEVIKIGESNSPLMKEIERIGPDSPIIQVKTPEIRSSSSTPLLTEQRKYHENMQTNDNADSLVDSCTGRKDIILQPQEILALYASPAQIAKGEMVSLANLFCFGTQVYLVVDTTAPLPHHKSKKSKTSESVPPLDCDLSDSANSDTKYHIPDEDSLGPIPEWLKTELANAIVPGATSNILPVFQNHNYDSKVNNSSSSSEIAELHKEHKLHQENSRPQIIHQNVPYLQPVSQSKKKSHTEEIQQTTQETLLRKELQKISLEKRQTEERLKLLEDKFSQENKLKQQVTDEVNQRQKELEREVAKLKVELERHQKYADNLLEIKDIQVIETENNVRSSKRERKSKPRRSKQRSKICILQ